MKVTKDPAFPNTDIHPVSSSNGKDTAFRAHSGTPPDQIDIGGESHPILQVSHRRALHNEQRLRDEKEVKEMAASKLMGYVRKSRAGQALNVSISVDAFEQARRYTTQQGSEFVRMVISLDRLAEVVSGEREVTGISQLFDEPEPTVEDASSANSESEA